MIQDDIDYGELRCAVCGCIGNRTCGHEPVDGLVEAERVMRKVAR